ncbi:MAG: hypothetical protein QM813_05855 [Verrucomicrobiota bacterium]
MKPTLSRRGFVTSSAAVAAATMSAASYARIKGANERIHLAQIGCGSRG